jgi:hypothetical protein
LYVETKAKNAESNNKDSLESRRIFLNKMNSTIIQWRTYLDSIVGDDLMMDEAKVDDFVAMVERAKALYNDRGGRNHRNGSESKGKTTRTPIICPHSNEKCNV